MREDNGVYGFDFTVIDYNSLTINASIYSSNSKLFFTNTIVSSTVPYFGILYNTGNNIYIAGIQTQEEYNMIADKVGQTIKMQLYTGTLS